MSCDLHIHSTCSDGAVPIERLASIAARTGLHAIALSDHDTLLSVNYCNEHPVQDGVRLLPATELTAYDYERAHRVHLLCMVSAVPHKQRFWFVRFYNCRFYRCGTDIQSQQKIFLLSA